ncbi:TetR/AcrR family transcriptional regulator [Aquirufa regiilacus]|jgi:AcrR family transcriptional regulator|uniref:TetR/AcrR family transcriptional regulator n=1 Tax=Aquirufa regiilacus TaxID=3024868 RepID=A0ABU3TS97_9BACT|nr:MULTISPECIES: TetR/AcrR family transcriptional regulator [unclassified Aquirufa]MDT8886359.1 TetR/AcrR family transcriptional regulator [Aquirufa sp. LEPPI-3A]MDU0808689.1 TetR/AcrR family transcriptional regulator [Aquirufa sp. LEOWEIH-7C]
MKSRILEKGTQLFFRYGVKSVTMDAIAAELGISKKTIYQHFPDKESMVCEVVKSFTEQDAVKWEELDKRYSNVIEKMFKSFEMVKDMLITMNPRLLFEIQKYFPTAFKLFKNHGENYIHKNLIADFKKGAQFGYFRNDVDFELLARLRMAEVDLVFNPDFYPNNKLSLYETQLTLMDIFMRGILTEKGLTLYNSYQNNLKS